ncbi:MAG: ATP-binding cassette domain-containing protein, partial [Deltaproteobacteria bacterium]
LMIAMLVNQRISRAPSESATRASARASSVGEQFRTASETIRGLGMGQAALSRWRKFRDAAVKSEVEMSDRNGTYSAGIKAMRMFLQSAMLALGAWLVINGMTTGGSMIASSILLGRALQPIEQIVGGWSSIARARRGWTSLGELLTQTPVLPPKTELPSSHAQLDVVQLTIVPPGESKPILSRVSFSLSPGQALGVLGESASGKSSLLKALAGLWKPAVGEIKLCGARIDQYDEARFAALIGYLSQEVTLFDGSVAQNIARLAETPDSNAVVRAAQEAAAHDMILGLRNGYDTPLGAGGVALSGGQKQRVGLARAMFGDPLLMLLDEPNANLDARGSEAVNQAIRNIKNSGRIAIIVAHRPAAIAECDLVLILRDGQVAAFGPRDEVLKRMLEPQGGRPLSADTPPARGSLQ